MASRINLAALPALRGEPQFVSRKQSPTRLVTAAAPSAAHAAGRGIDQDAIDTATADRAMAGWLADRVGYGR
ncbi:hypothetical protein [Glycomyces buryatensis]|uniref:Uncharacterized protein n=1 Tax=Glycomyces buryatensis TaxID=2570927 RepID=A0A4S8Q363_9ACTN|nr:hypothetical protein [Glycomyces buryatensis]THV38647.1 hypothetical protein FAB82_19655 [Glycomyces buryatensis]